MTNSLTGIANLHDFDKTFTTEFDTNQTAVDLLTPTSGKVLKITGLYINTEASSGKIRVYFSDDENDAENTILSTHVTTNPCTGYVPLIMRGDRNASAKVTSTLGADQNYFILINYKEE